MPKLPECEVILCISDMHHPYSHPDLIPFLSAIKDHYNPTQVVSIGDEVDYHAISFHSHDPDLFSPGQELEKAIEHLQPLYKLFPTMQIIESNHGSLVYRKQKHAGLPRSVFKEYRDILEAPEGWSWHRDLTLRMVNGLDVFFTHGMKANVTLLSKNMSMCVVQGHYHSKFKVEYWANTQCIRWGMQIGCLINDHSMAFEYNNTTMERPIIGTGIIIDGHPMLLPMVLNKKGRWIGRLV
jgi:predicted phosphodiesterase